MQEKSALHYTKCHQCNFFLQRCTSNKYCYYFIYSFQFLQRITKVSKRTNDAAIAWNCANFRTNKLTLRFIEGCSSIWRLTRNLSSIERGGFIRWGSIFNKVRRDPPPSHNPSTNSVRFARRGKGEKKFFLPSLALMAAHGPDNPINFFFHPSIKKQDFDSGLRALWTFRKGGRYSLDDL